MVRSSTGRWWRRDAGMVTAETAVVLPVLLLVLAGAVAAVTVVGAQLRCVDAAREGARAAARGESVAEVTRSEERRGGEEGGWRGEGERWEHGDRKEVQQWRR